MLQLNVPLDMKGLLLLIHALSPELSLMMILVSPAVHIDYLGALKKASLGPDVEAGSPDQEVDEDRDVEAEGALRQRVEKLVEEKINPGLDSHGGYLELLDVRGTTLYVHMGGGCQGCAMSAATLKQGVESILRS